MSRWLFNSVSDAIGNIALATPHLRVQGKNLEGPSLNCGEVGRDLWRASRVQHPGQRSLRESAACLGRATVRPQSLTEAGSVAGLETDTGRIILRSADLGSGAFDFHRGQRGNAATLVTPVWDRGANRNRRWATWAPVSEGSREVNPTELGSLRSAGTD